MGGGTGIGEPVARRFVALRRAGTPDEIAGICVSLARADSSFRTGSTIMNDGDTHFVDAFAAAVGDLGLNFA